MTLAENSTDHQEVTIPIGGVHFGNPFKRSKTSLLLGYLDELNPIRNLLDLVSCDPCQ
jgi:hypothetical protein